MHDRGRAAVASKFGEGAEKFLAPAKVQSRCGLVEQQQFGVRHQGARDLDALALALAQGPELAVREGVHAEGRE